MLACCIVVRVEICFNSKKKLPELNQDFMAEESAYIVLCF